MSTPSNNYSTLVDALNDLRERGYTHDFNLKKDSIYCKKLDLDLKPEQFQVHETYRFEGESNPADSSIVFAIESERGLKGVLVSAYGAYSEGISQELLKRLG